MVRVCRDPSSLGLSRRRASDLTTPKAAVHTHRMCGRRLGRASACACASRSGLGSRAMSAHHAPPLQQLRSWLQGGCMRRSPSLRCRALNITSPGMVNHESPRAPALQSLSLQTPKLLLAPPLLLVPSFPSLAPLPPASTAPRGLESARGRAYAGRGSLKGVKTKLPGPDSPSN